MWSRSSAKCPIHHGRCCLSGTSTLLGSNVGTCCVSVHLHILLLSSTFQAAYLHQMRFLIMMEPSAASTTSTLWLGRFERLRHTNSQPSPTTLTIDRRLELDHQLPEARIDIRIRALENAESTRSPPASWSTMAVPVCSPRQRHREQTILDGHENNALLVTDVIAP